MNKLKAISAKDYEKFNLPGTKDFLIIMLDSIEKKLKEEKNKHKINLYNLEKERYKHHLEKKTYIPDKKQKERILPGNGGILIVNGKLEIFHFDLSHTSKYSKSIKNPLWKRLFNKKVNSIIKFQYHDKKYVIKVKEIWKYNEAQKLKMNSINNGLFH